MLGFVSTISSLKTLLLALILEGLRLSKKTIKPDQTGCTVFVFLYGPTIMQRETSEARMAQATQAR